MTIPSNISSTKKVTAPLGLKDRSKSPPVLESVLLPDVFIL